MGKFTHVAAMAFLALSLNAYAAEAPETITVTSTAFEHHGTVPEEYTAYSENRSIDLSWSNLPAGTVQLALICDDPEVVTIGMMESPFPHWVAYNIPASAPGLPKDMTKDAAVTGIAGLEGMINGVNGTNRAGYFGPRPPVNGHLHAYHFRVYALDAALNLPQGLNKAQLLDAIEGHVLATGMLMGHYERKAP
jgi:Raf kinase inhibitor-like YbhB/YbcL family protein